MDLTTAKLLNTALDLTGNGLIIFDRMDNVAYCNLAASELFGYNKDEMVNKPYEEIVRHAYQAQVGISIQSEDIDELLTDDMHNRRSEVYRSFEVDTFDGRWFLINEQMIDDDHLCVFFIDKTDSHSAEEELAVSKQELSQAATKDILTGVLNHGAFVQQSTCEINRSYRANQPTGLILIDLCKLKDINDKYGHRAGDHCLVQTSNLLKDLFRDYDLIGRLDGDTFAVLVATNEESNIQTIIKRTQELFENYQLDYEGRSFSAQITVGAHILTRSQLPFDQMHHNAEEALLEAKVQGGGSVVITK